MTVTRYDLLFLFLLAAFVIVMIPSVPRDPFDYDPSDYMYAASRGFVSNYTDENAIPIVTFLKMGMESGRDSTKRAALSAYIRNSEDISLYRHYHAPLSFYYLVFVGNVFGNGEYTMRWAMLFLHLLAAVAIYYGVRSLAREAGPEAPLFSTLLFLTSVINIETAFKVSPHALFVLLSLATLFLLARMVKQGSLAGWYAAVSLLCGAMLTYEYALFLLILFLLVLLLERKKLFSETARGEARKLLWISAGFFLLLFFVLWPAGIYKLTAVKNYIFIAYFALVRKENIPTPGAAAVWWERFAKSPAEFLLIAAALTFVLYLFFTRREFRWLSPFLLFILLMLIVSAGNSLPNPTYVSSLFAALFVPAGIGLAALLRGRKPVIRIAAGGLVCLILVANNAHHFLHRTPDPSGWKRSCLIGHLQSVETKGRSILVPKEFFPTAHYYFRDAKVDWFDDAQPAATLGQKLRSAGYSYALCLMRGGGGAGIRVPGYGEPRRICTAPDGEEALYLLSAAD